MKATFHPLPTAYDAGLQGIARAAPKRPRSCIEILRESTYLYAVPKGHRPIAGGTRQATRGELQQLAEAFRPVHHRR